jgi:hypothetical protein
MKNSFLKPSSVTSQIIVDSSTGEVIEQSVHKTNYLANSKEEFYLTYSSMTMFLLNSSDTNVKLFGSLISKYSSGDEFAITRGLKNAIAEQSGCSSRSLDNAVSYLVKNKYLVRVAHGLYRINPRHIFKGSSSERNSKLKAILEVECPDC